MSKFFDCPCCSKQLYHKCCKPFHDGKAVPDSAEQLMRSRYSAFALGDASYIMSTTHPANHEFTQDRSNWEASIRSFSQNTKFCGLRILSKEADYSKAYVTFTASLIQDNRDASFTERSEFLREDGRWFYHVGELIES